MKEWLSLSIKWIFKSRYQLQQSINKCNGNKEALLMLKNNLYLAYYKQHSEYWVAKEFSKVMDRAIYER